MVDIPGRKFRVTAHTHTVMSNIAPADMYVTTEITFDGNKGYASWRSEIGTNSTLRGQYDAKNCLRVEFPQGLMASSHHIKKQLEKEKPTVEFILRRTPHVPMTINGQAVNVFPIGSGHYFALHKVTGTPYAVMDFGAKFESLTNQEKKRVKAKFESGELKPGLIFPRWEEVPDVEIDEVHCFLNKPPEQNAHVTLALAAAEQVLAGLQGIQPMSSAPFAPLGVQPSTILKMDQGQFAPNSCQELLASSQRMSSTTSFVTIWALFASVALFLSVSLVIWKRYQAPKLEEMREYLQVS